MRLLFIIDHLSSGGAQRQMATLATELTRRGHDIEFFVYQTAEFFGERLRDAGIKIHVVEKPSKYSWKPVWAIRRLIKQGGFDAALAFLQSPGVYAILARSLTRSKIPLVVGERCCASREVWGRRQRLIERFYRFADHVTTNSHHLREYYLDHYSWSHGKISTIWNGIELDEFQSKPEPSRNGTLKLITIGRVAYYKNWLCLVNALALLRDKYDITAHVNCVGRLTELTETESRYLDDVKAAIAKHDLDDHWQWFGTSHDVPSLISQHHGLVHTSYVEGLPNTVCEAMACGRPAIVSDTLDHPRLVQDGRTGFLFDWQDPESLSAAVSKLNALSNQEAQAMGRASREFAEQRLSVERMGDAYEKLFDDLIEQHGRKKPSVLFVGAFRRGTDGSLGGQWFACVSLVASPLSKLVNWRLIESGTTTNPPPGLVVRTGEAILRVMVTLWYLITSKVHGILFFTGFTPTSLAEKSLIALLGKLFRKRVAMSIQHGPRPPEWPVLHSLFAKLAIRCSDTVICQSPINATQLKEYYGCDDKRIMVIGNWIDTDSYHRPPREPAERGDKVTILFAGSLEKRKGADFLIEAFHQLIEEGLPVRLLVCGSGPLSEQLESRCAELRMDEHVEFRGWVAGDELLDAYHESDMFVLPTFSEGLPNAMLEAMACGLPVVTTAVDGIPYVVEEGKNGLFVPPGEVEPLAAALRTLVQDRELAAGMGATNIVTIKEKHDIATVWPRMAKAIDVEVPIV